MIYIDKDECVGCESCVADCPIEAISMKDDKAEINQELCDQCKVCVDACPVEAIKVSDE